LKGSLNRFHRSIMNKIQNYFLSLVLCLALSPSLLVAQTPTGYEIKKVVIDPGHGGKDPGAIGTGRYKTTESDIVLAIGLKLEEYLNQYYDSLEVVMTRNTDDFIELKERAHMANDCGADLFISLHCNSNSSHAPYGTETYVMGLTREKANLEVARVENSVIYLEEDYEEKYSGFDPNSPESYIGASIMQSTFLENSILFAQFVQDEFRSRVKRADRGVKQSVLYVLDYTAMPSVLIELGFISNQAEEDFLNDEMGQVYLASALYRAFKRYKIQLEGVDNSIQPSKKISVNAHDTVEVEEPTKSDSANISKDSLGVKDSIRVEKTEKGIQNQTADSLIFMVQVAASNNRIELDTANFKGLSDVQEIKTENRYRYALGSFRKFEEAMNYQKEIRKTKYPDAFIIAIYKGERISLQRAFEIMRNQS
jgi:N-acetylmuramoyl-L-alanine amidase